MIYLTAYAFIQAFILVAACIFAVMEARIDSNSILLEIKMKKHSLKGKFHTQNFWRRSTLVSSALLLPYGLGWYLAGWLPALIQAASLGLLIGSIFWILFNGFMNYFLNRSLLQHGQTSKIDIWLNNSFKRLPAWFEQGAALLISLTLYIIFTGVMFICYFIDTF